MTTNDFIQRLELFEDELKRIVLVTPQAKGQEILGVVLGRIFNDATATDGTKIGKYKPGKYKALRNKKGLRIDTVDTEFTGELFRSLIVGQSGEDTVYGFKNLNRAKVAEYLEKKYGKKIYVPSDGEIEDAKVLMIDYVKEELNNAIKDIFGGK